MQPPVRSPISHFYVSVECECMTYPAYLCVYAFSGCCISPILCESPGVQSCRYKHGRNWLDSPPPKYFNWDQTWEGAPPFRTWGYRRGKLKNSWKGGWLFIWVFVCLPGGLLFGPSPLQDPSPLWGEGGMCSYFIGILEWFLKRAVCLQGLRATSRITPPFLKWCFWTYPKSLGVGWRREVDLAKNNVKIFAGVRSCLGLLGWFGVITFPLGPNSGDQIKLPLFQGNCPTIKGREAQGREWGDHNSDK